MTRWNAFVVERQTRPEEAAAGLGDWTFVSSPKTRDSALRVARKLSLAGDVVRVKERSSRGIYRTLPLPTDPAATR